MKILTTIQALILAALTVYGASAAAEKPVHAPDCPPTSSDCLEADVTTVMN
ncbi:hypothetical protein FIU97_07895 [Roseivivax sp. THAF40]|uniref:hypothetical protein n=1 Tax=unclassified Roseivivax TaxID=2639302 RepID=UPI0012A9A4CF|nr:MULTISPECIES: hypothetical protein [unclassified Roseivivax]QFS82719.1 hypothetical protein FIV09_07790 [Roseivivax sp. THAF197b]QFT46488.1 hypothetical protein FIU97_07895 [Roseivivax sp. THAF40]